MENKFRVFKFGGSSLVDSEAISKVRGIIQSEYNTGLVIVVSAMGGVTDLLINTAIDASQGKTDGIEAAVKQFKEKHEKVIESLVKDSKGQQSLREFVDTNSHEFRAICQSLATLRELTSKSMAKTVARGERLTARFMNQLLLDFDIPSEYIDAKEVIKVTNGSSGLCPESDLCDKICQDKIIPHLEQNKVVVVPGFIAEDLEGELTTLGRGGSDYSATILAASINAQNVILYKEVDGLMTADPKYVPDSHVVPEFHYREAAELAYYGAKVLHPKTIIPLVKKQIPLIIKNTFHSHLKGTRIAGDVLPGAYPVKALTATMNRAVISVEGKGMMGVPGIAGRTFGSLARFDLSVSMISQSSSESSICFVIPQDQASQAANILREEFRFEISHQLIDDIKVKGNNAVVAVIGLGMSGTRGTAARTFAAMARKDINIEAIAQGSSELNISFALRSQEVPEALRSLHQEFKLNKMYALGHRQKGEVNIALYGLGQIGQNLVSQLINQNDHFVQNMHVTCRMVSVADSSGIVVREHGFDTDELIKFQTLKENGEKLFAEATPSKTINDFSEMLKSKLWSKPFGKGIFVDVTAEETAPLLSEALNEGMHVVLANKKPLAVPYEEYERIFKIARMKKLMIRYEATVGAGLPILDTLAKLQAAGDEAQTILGCLSGTIGFLVTNVEDGVAFSQAVKKAYDLGYTEPDPRDDLSGMDVARKALILARNLGYRINMEDIELEPLFPESLSHDDPHIFIENLKSIDASLKERVNRAKRENSVLRYVARIAGGDVSVKLEVLNKNTPLGNLRGTNNQVTVKTKRYDQNQLVVTGPGAGAGVTAAGVLNDIVAISTTFE